MCVRFFLFLGLLLLGSKYCLSDDCMPITGKSQALVAMCRLKEIQFL